jgi:integrase/recombinase XerD
MTEILPAVLQSNPTPQDLALSRIRALVLDSTTSDNTKRSYAAAIDRFLLWHQSTRPGSGFTKAAVHAFRTHLVDLGLAPGSVNVHLSAVRALAREASDNGLMDIGLAGGISRVKGIKQEGRKIGNWLTSEQAGDLIRLPDISTLKGKRDRALLGLMVGSGIRREEAASLMVSHVRMLEARWVLTDISGKGRRIRSVPIPAFVKAAIDVWTEASGITEGRLFRPVNKGGKLAGDSMTAQSVFVCVKFYAKKLGMEGIAPHDLRRSFARLAHRGHSPIEQISLSLGHNSIKTTEIYLGFQQDLQHAPCDDLGIKV